MNQKSIAEMKQLADTFLAREGMLAHYSNAERACEPELMADHERDLKELAIFAINLLRSNRMMVMLPIESGGN